MTLTRSHSTLLLALGATVLAACGSSSSPPPAPTRTPTTTGTAAPTPTPTPGLVVYQGGWSYDPPSYADHPIPVWWNGQDAPTKLPMLTYAGECPPAGSVEAMTVVGGEVIMVGLSSLCFEGNENMKPVMWHGGLVTQLAFYDSMHVLGLAKGVASLDGVVYIVGAEGVTDPMPTLWVDGFPIAIPLPEGWDAGEAEAITISGQDIFVSALLSQGLPGELKWGAGYWKLDATLSTNEWTPVPLPDPEHNGLNPYVPLAIAGSGVWAGYNPTLNGPGDVKAALAMNGGAAIPLVDFEFGAEPSAEIRALTTTGTSTVASGYETLPEQYGYPGPVVWVNTTVQKLSTIDPSLGIGQAYGQQLLGADLYVTGTTYRKDTEDPTKIIGVPAYWVNGVRHDREGLPNPAGAVAPSTFAKWPAWPEVSVDFSLPAAGHYNAGTSQDAVPHAIAVVER